MYFCITFWLQFFYSRQFHKRKKKDFTFVGRLVLLFFIACINSALFPGEILGTLCFLIGYVLIAVCRFSTRTVMAIAIVLLLQPFEWGQIIYALFNPEYTGINAQLDAPYWEIVNVARERRLFLRNVQNSYMDR